jgi:type II secretory pathway component GspD/PulD (secretin)
MKTLALTLAVLAPALQQDRGRDEVDAKLRSLRVTLDFADTPLDAVVDYLREISDINLIVDSKVRERDLRVKLKVNDVALRSVLNLMLKPHGCDTMFRDGVLVIMNREDVQDRTLKLELYDCRDILHPITDFPGIDLDLGQGVGIVTQFEPSVEAAEIPIEELVKGHTGGKSWDENPKCSCRMQNGILVVRQTPEVHRQVVRLLDLLRRNK